jgi:NAD(P)-dependent dehydrogenase (short-subunit alcohol dehydrogenase family)
MPKTVFITGASTGIGRATAEHFVQQGWNVAATMRRPEASQLIPNDRVLLTPLNVEQPATIDPAVAATLARFGAIDVLVNNAGFGLNGIFESLPDAAIRQQFEVNVFGVMAVTRAVLPQMRQQGSGVILNISSRAGLVGLPMLSLYSASKFALEGFSEGLYFELASQNIAVKLIEPSGGITGTDFLARAANEKLAELPASYEPFRAHASTTFRSTAAAATTPAETIAEAIFNAATDGTPRLRYFLGEDTGDYHHRRQTQPEAEYLTYMRSRFLPPSNQ